MKLLQKITGFCRHRPLTCFLFVVAIVAIWCSNNRMVHPKFWKHTISMDGRGYYTYLPALFIYNDPSCSFYKNQSSSQPDTVDFINMVDGKPVNKYFSGVSICQLPFFTLAHFFAKSANIPANGYTKPYHYAVAFAGIFYFLAGLFFLWKLLETFNFKPGVIFFVSTCFAFGTNLLYYAAFEPSMSHVYSFAFITAFLFYSRSFLLAPSKKGIVLLSILLGIVVLIRPVNGMIICALPFLAGSWVIFRDALRWVMRNISWLLLALVVFLSICSIQLLLYYWQTGHFFVWSYKSEGFDFRHPRIFGTLFSYQKGLFVYMPVLLFGVIGLFFLAKKSMYQFIALVPVLAIIVFVISSWHDWKYGFSFGARAYIDFYALLALPFAFLADFLSTRRTVFVFFIFICAALVTHNFIQIYQYANHIIHPGAMNKERYWTIFLKTGKKYEDTLSRLPYQMESEGDCNEMEGAVDWPGMETIDKGPAHSGESSSRIDAAAPYSAGFCKNMSDEIFDATSSVKISAWVMKKDEKDNGALIILRLSADSSLFTKEIPLPANMKKGEWRNINATIDIPKRMADPEFLKVFFLRYEGTLYVDDFCVTVDATE